MSTGAGTVKTCNHNFRETGKIRIRLHGGGALSAWSPWVNIG
ncbi:hypothetical protein [Streptomyces sp. NPDC047315]